MIFGFGVIYRNKVIHGRAHFTSLHGKMGLLTLVLALLSPVLGALSFKSLGLINMLPGQSLRSFWVPSLFLASSLDPL